MRFIFQHSYKLLPSSVLYTGILRHTEVDAKGWLLLLSAVDVTSFK